jgi:hypothetical protein
LGQGQGLVRVRVRARVRLRVGVMDRPMSARDFSVGLRYA